MSGVIQQYLSAISGHIRFNPNLSIANNTDGWMTYAELKWLAKKAKKHHTIVEIGSYHGRSTRAMADNSQAKIYAVDDFLGPRDKTITPLPHLELFIGNMNDHVQSGKVQIVVANTNDLPELPRPDMVFIDGSHQYNDVVHDINYWKERILPGGLICGHDYTNIEDVKRAVDEVLPKARVAHKTSIWYTYEF